MTNRYTVVCVIGGIDAPPFTCLMSNGKPSAHSEDVSNDLLRKCEQCVEKIEAITFTLTLEQMFTQLLVNVLSVRVELTEVRNVMRWPNA